MCSKLKKLCLYRNKNLHAIQRPKFTLLLENSPRRPDLFRIRPPVMVPMREVFFSRIGLIDCCMELIDLSNKHISKQLLEKKGSFFYL